MIAIKPVLYRKCLETAKHFVLKTICRVVEPSYSVLKTVYVSAVCLALQD